MEVWLLPGPLICVIGVIALGKSSRKTKGLKEASCRDPPPLTQRKISWESLFASIIIYHIPFLLSIYLSIYLIYLIYLSICLSVRTCVIYICVYPFFSSNNYIVSMYHIYSMSIESIGISGLSETSWTITKLLELPRITTWKWPLQWPLKWPHQFLHFSILARNLAPRPWPLVGSSSWELLPLQPPASTAIKREKNKLRKKITLKTTPGLCAIFKRVQNIRKNAHTHTRIKYGTPAGVEDRLDVTMSQRQASSLQQKWRMLSLEVLWVHRWGTSTSSPLAFSILLIWYPLVNVYIAMENHHFQWVNPL